MKKEIISKRGSILQLLRHYPSASYTDVANAVKVSQQRVYQVAKQEGIIAEREEALKKMNADAEEILRIARQTAKK